MLLHKFEDHWSWLTACTLSHAEAGYHLTDRWFQLGGLMASTALKAHSTTKPLDWKTPVYSQFAMIGLSIIIFVFLPESPCEFFESKTHELELKT
jgi:hypothetical protein